MWMTRRLNVELVKNKMAEDLGLTDSGALVCAETFESSLRFSGLLDSDGTVTNRPSGSSPVVAEKPAEQNGGTATAMTTSTVTKTAPTAGSQQDMQEQTLILDKTNRSKTISIIAPISITPAEY